MHLTQNDITKTDQERIKLVSVHRQAVQAAMKEVERNMEVRVRKGKNAGTVAGLGLQPRPIVQNKVSMTIYKTKIGMNDADWVTNPVQRGSRLWRGKPQRRLSIDKNGKIWDINRE